MITTPVLCAFSFGFAPCCCPIPGEAHPSANIGPGAFKAYRSAQLQPCTAEVSSDRTNLSPFTKDYRGLALQCDLKVFGARERTHENQNKQLISIGLPKECVEGVLAGTRVIPITRSPTSVPSRWSWDGIVTVFRRGQFRSN